MSPLSSAPPAWPATDDLPARRTLRRVAWRLLPFLGLLYVVAYLDRINRHSDRRGERRWHVAGSLVLAAAGAGLAAATQTLPLALLAFSVAAIGVWGVMGPFWALATALLSGTAAAAGIALINSLGNVGGFLGPYLMGWLKQTTASFSAGLTVVALILLAGCALVLLLRLPRQMDAAADVPAGSSDPAA